MKNTIRTFIAIKITPQQKLQELASRLKFALKEETIKWVETDNLHLTLRFLGETTSDQVHAIGNVLEKLKEKFQPFQFQLRGVGYFKRNNQPSVLFLKIESDQILKQLAKEIENEITNLGFKNETRNFKPHLTLARIKFVKNSNAFYSLVDDFKEKDIQVVEASEILFYQSILSSSGPEYKPLKTVKLN